MVVMEEMRDQKIYKMYRIQIANADVLLTSGHEK